MKNFLTRLFFFCFSIPFLTAQNYQAFRSDVTALFQQKRGTEIQAIRFDSIGPGGTTLYPFTQMQGEQGGCFSPKGPHWIGGKVEILPSGDHLFFNKFGDTILLQNQARVGTEWEVYNVSNGLKVIGRIRRIYASTFLGITDSVKEIRFSLFDQNDRPISSDLNNMAVLLSKHYGLIQILNFQQFPLYQDDYFGEQLQEYRLIGLSNPMVGVQNLTWLEAHDFEVGEEIHSIYYQVTNYPWLEDPNSKTIKRIEKYLEKTTTTDSISYLVLVESEIKEIFKGDTTLTFTQEEVTRTYHPDPAFDHLPGEVVDHYGEGFKFYSMFQDDFLSKTLPSIPDHFLEWIHDGDTCLTNSWADGCYDHYFYHKNLGGPYFTCQDPFGGQYRENRLIYFKNDSTEWGRPIDFTTSTTKVEKLNNVEISPNPTSGDITIKSPNSSIPISIRIYTYDGRLIQEEQLKEPETRIDLRASGLLFYQIINSGGALLKSGKIVVQPN